MSIHRPTLSEYALFIAGIVLIGYGLLAWGASPGGNSSEVGAIILGAVCIGFGWALQRRRFEAGK